MSHTHDIEIYLQDGVVVWYIIIGIIMQYTDYFTYIL